ncbi:MAG TPA: adenylate/guanylate cyclase domain-containing protein, partial [Actinomycetota bacterium]|nr:adenylate/guanylate cyclase domain-containing protein [Actinomycetota bacterium]
MELCDWCGNPLPAGARFCPTCGAPVGPIDADTGELATAVPGQTGITERKVVTVLFADVVRSTELAAMLDPERFSEVMAAFFQMVERELTSLRGRAEKFIGDAVLAVFGVPHAHEDDALRAVRAALFIRDRTVRLGERLALPVPLRVHIGINSGPVAAGPEATGWSGASTRPLISGATVNLAARLQQAAEPGEVLIGETTRQLVRHAVAFDAERDVAAKGFGGPVHGWPVTALAPRMHRRTIPLVGRRAELGLLEQTFDRVRESSHAALATVLGEPGIGKSRLVDEFLVQLPSDVKVMQGRSGDYEEDPAFAPIAEMLRRELGLDRDAPAEEFRERLEEVVAG